MPYGVHLQSVYEAFEVQPSYSLTLAQLSITGPLTTLYISRSFSNIIVRIPTKHFHLHNALESVYCASIRLIFGQCTIYNSIKQPQPKHACLRDANVARKSRGAPNALWERLSDKMALLPPAVGVAEVLYVYKWVGKFA